MRAPRLESGGRIDPGRFSQLSGRTVSIGRGCHWSQRSRDAAGILRAQPQASDAAPSVQRRTLLAGLSSLALVRPAFAEEPTTLLPGNGQSAPVDTTSLQYVYEFASDVQSNLRVKEYIGIINTTRRRCWAEIAQCIQTKQYAKLALQPTQTPFSDLRAAALYCAWALLQADDYSAAADCRRAYLDFDVHVKDLVQIAEAADLDGANPEQVQQSFILLNASLENLLASVPSKYLQG